MKNRTTYTCPLELAHDVIRGKWKPIILWQLGKSDHSPAQLEKEISGISQKMLLEALRELTDCGLIAKTAASGYPLHVQYALTPRGRHMLEAITVLQQIGIDMMQEDGRQDFLRAKGLIE